MMHIDQALANHDGESSAGVVEKVVCVSAASIEQGGMLSGRTRCGVWAGKPCDGTNAWPFLAPCRRCLVYRHLGRHYLCYFLT